MDQRIESHAIVLNVVEAVEIEHARKLLKELIEERYDVPNIAWVGAMLITCFEKIAISTPMWKDLQQFIHRYIVGRMKP
jgi:hypothetical protein